MIQGKGRTLEDRIRAIEDRLEIYNLIASHPPSADIGADYYARAVYAEDGVFDRGEGLSGATGNEAIAKSLKSEGHQAAIAGGLAHFAGLPHIALDGDTAVVTSYLQILTPKKSGDMVEVPNHGSSRGYHIHRVVTNRWELARTAQGWRIKRRSLRLVDGSEPSREILRGALKEYETKASSSPGAPQAGSVRGRSVVVLAHAARRRPDRQRDRAHRGDDAGHRPG